MYEKLYLIKNPNDVRTFDEIPTALYPVTTKPAADHVELIQNNDGKIAIEYYNVKNGKPLLYRVSPTVAPSKNGTIIRYAQV